MSGSKAVEKREKYTQRCIEVSVSLFPLETRIEKSGKYKEIEPEVHRGLRVDTPS